MQRCREYGRRRFLRSIDETWLELGVSNASIANTEVQEAVGLKREVLIGVEAYELVLPRDRCCRLKYFDEDAVLLRREPRMYQGDDPLRTSIFPGVLRAVL